MNLYRAEILTIGSELLTGSTLNTNAKFLGFELSELGFEVAAQISCPDRLKTIQRKIGESFHRSDLVILTGGLGPTPDDITRDAVAAFLKSPLVFSPKQYRFIQKQYRIHKRRIPSIVRREAYFPAKAVPLFNHYGIALGFYVHERGRLIVVLPGVPHELEAMFHHLVAPLIRKTFPKARKSFTFTMRMTGLSEPEVMEKLGKDYFDEPFTFGIYPEPSEVSIRIQTESKHLYEKLRKKARQRLEKWIFSEDSKKLHACINEKMIQKRRTLSVAESCTGGLVASLLTQVPGSSKYFRGSVTAYANDIKEKVLGVSKTVLKTKGAVSQEVSVQMAKGIREKFSTTYGIGITGIAGPGGGAKAKPVGLVYIAVAGPHQIISTKQTFLGNRSQVQLKAAKKAMQLLWKAIAS